MRKGSGNGYATRMLAMPNGAGEGLKPPRHTLRLPAVEHASSSFSGPQNAELIRAALAHIFTKETTYQETLLVLRLSIQWSGL